MKRLTVLYDAECGFCVRCRRWLESQPTFLRLEFLPKQSPQVARRFPGAIREGEKDELIVISDEGGVYRRERAWIMCLYALKEYREWSLRLANPTVLPYVRHVDDFFGRRRHALSRWLGWKGEEAWAEAFRNTPNCEGKPCNDSPDATTRRTTQDSVWMNGIAAGARCPSCNQLLSYDPQDPTADVKFCWKCGYRLVRANDPMSPLW